MTGHLAIMALCAACIATVFAVLHRDDARSQLIFAGRVFGALIGGALILGALQNLFFH